MLVAVGTGILRMISCVHTKGSGPILCILNTWGNSGSNLEVPLNPWGPWPAVQGSPVA